MHLKDKEPFLLDNEGSLIARNPLIRDVMISTLTTQHLILSAPSSGDLSAINNFEIRNDNHLFVLSVVAI